MLDIGFQELLVLLVIALLVFGPYKLPELGRALGRAMREFRRASDEFRSTIETNLNLNETLADDSRPSAADAPATAGETASAPAAPAPDLPAPADPVPFGAPTLEGEGFGAPPPVAPVEPFCAQRGGRLLHRATCAWAARIPEADRIVLKAAAEGGDLGLVACPVCDPRDGEAAA